MCNCTNIKHLNMSRVRKHFLSYFEQKRHQKKLAERQHISLFEENHIFSCGLSAVQCFSLHSHLSHHSPCLAFHFQMAPHPKAELLPWDLVPFEIQIPGAISPIQALPYGADLLQLGSAQDVQLDIQQQCLFKKSLNVWCNTTVQHCCIYFFKSSEGYISWFPLLIYPWHLTAFVVIRWKIYVTASIQLN